MEKEKNASAGHTTFSSFQTIFLLSLILRVIRNWVLFGKGQKSISNIYQLPDNQFLALSDLKAFKTAIINVTQSIEFIFQKVENIIRKG